MGLHRVVLQSGKIPLDLYYLEVFASNGHSQVNFWTFVMVLLALDPPIDYESNEHLFGNLSMGVHRVVLKSDKIPQGLYYLEVFASNGALEEEQHGDDKIFLLDLCAWCSNYTRRWGQC